MKKALTIILIVGALGLFGFAVYLLFPGTSRQAADNIIDILPFGSGDNVTFPTTNDPELTDEIAEQPVFDEFGIPTTNLFRISDTPVAGAVAFNTRSTSSGQASTSTATVRYVDRATGHIYDFDLQTFERVKITNQTLPKIYEAYFRPDGGAVLFRSLKELDAQENISLTLIAPKATSTDNLYSLSASILRGDISDVVVGPGNALFYVVRDPSSIITSAFNGSGQKTIINSAFNNWRLLRSGNNIVAYTKASSEVPGFAYTLNVSNGSLTKILGPLNGLVVSANTSGNRIAYSYSEAGRYRLHSKELSSSSGTDAGFSTIAEKCVWSTIILDRLYCGIPNGSMGVNEPDNWYKGVTHFSDNIWILGAGASFTEPYLLAEPRNLLGVDLDLYNPQLSPNEDFLIFQNRRDLSLWALKLE